MRPWILASLLIAVPAAAEYPWTFADRQPLSGGESWSETARWEGTGHTKITVGPVNVRDRVVDDTRAWTCDVAVDAVAEDVPTGLTVGCRDVLMVESGEAQAVGLSGSAVGAGAPGKRKWKVDGKRARKPAREFLDGTFGDVGILKRDLARYLLPDKPVQVGDTWTIAPEIIENAFGEDRFVLDRDASKGDVTLLDVVQKGGESFGKLQFDVLIIPASITDGEFSAARMALAGTAELPLRGDLPFRTLDVQVEMRFDGTVRAKGVQAKLDIDQTLSGTVAKTPRG